MIHAQIRANRRKAMLLVALMALLLLATGFVAAELYQPGSGPWGLLVAFAVWLGLTLVSYFQGDQIFLALAGAHEVRKKDAPQLYNVVEEMCLASGLTTQPRIYLIDAAAPNAFATGRSPQHAAVAVTSGLLETLDRNELQGVIAHELAHIHNRDILYMNIAGIMVGAVVLIAESVRYFRPHSERRRTHSSQNNSGADLLWAVVALALLILAPLMAELLYLAISRRREYLADACGALYTRYPEGLASALEKITAGIGGEMPTSRVLAPMYIANPLQKVGQRFAVLRSTHPEPQARIAILRAMGGKADLASYQQGFAQVTGKTLRIASVNVPSGPALVPPVDARTPLERHRETTDLLWKQQDFQVRSCACGVSLKVPPAYKGQAITCPRCQQVLP